MKARFLFVAVIWLGMALFVTENVYSQGVLTLKDCIQIALMNNSQYRNAQSRVGIAEATVIGSYTRILPQFNASANGSENRLGPYTSERNTAIYKTDDLGRMIIDEEGIPIVEKYVKTINLSDKMINNNYAASFSVSQLIYDGGAWWNRIKERKRSRTAREYDEQSSRINTIISVKQYYYELLRAHDQLIVRQEAVRLAEEQLKSAQSRYEIGVAAQIDVFRSQVLYNTDKITLLNQKTQVEIAKADLNNIMGRNPNEPIMVMEDSTIQDISLSIEEAQAKAMENNPEVKGRKEDIESARYGYKAARAGYLPTLRGSASYSRRNPKFERVYSYIDRNYSWNYSFSLSIPIFDGLLTKSQIQSAAYNLDIAEEDLIDAKRRIERDARMYYITLKSYLEEIEMRKENLVAAEENLRLARERYNVGAGTLLEMIDAQVSLTDSRIQHVAAIYNSKIIEAQLAGALGVESLSEL